MPSEKPAFLDKENTFHRTFEIRAADAEKRTVELSFSSETTEVERWWGVEVLGHEPGEVRMGRLQSGAPLLVNHDRDQQAGVVEEAEINAKDRKGRATVRFGKSAFAEEIFADVRDGIRKLVSVGYRVHAAKLIETRDGGVDVYRATDWEPYEISIVSIPADTSVGVGRAAEIAQEEPAATSQDSAGNNAQPTRGTRMTTEATTAPDLAAERKAGAEAESARSASILSMGEQYKALDLASQFVREGKTASDFQAALLKRFNEQTSRPLAEQSRAGDIGLTDKEVKRFSLHRAIRHLADPGNQEARKAAAFELECSRAAQDAYGKEAKGVLVPADVLTRGFSTTAPASNTGANIVGTELQSGSFIELLRNRTWVLKHARKLAGLVGNVDIPKATVSNTAYWVGEGSAPTAGEMGVNKISLTPKTLAAYSDITRKLLIQSSPDAEALTRDDLLKTMAIAIDYAAIYGSASSNQPRGVKNYSGINAVDFGVAAAPTFAELVAMETSIAADNADVASMLYAAGAAFRGYAKTTVKFSSTDATIWEPGNTVNGYACEISNQIAAGDVFFGNWAELIVALWSGLDLTVDPYALSTSGGLRVIAFQDIDFQVRHVESFCYGVLVP